MFKAITPLQERDSCLAFAFLFLVIWFFSKSPVCIYIAMAIMLLGMIWPGAMRPAAFLWFGLARVLGHFTSSILLAIIWVVMVLPVGYARRMMGKDSLGLKNWKNGAASAFIRRDHTYTADDLKHPY